MCLLVRKFPFKMFILLKELQNMKVFWNTVYFICLVLFNFVSTLNFFCRWHSLWKSLIEDTSQSQIKSVKTKQASQTKSKQNKPYFRKLKFARNLYHNVSNCLHGVYLSPLQPLQQFFPRSQYILSNYLQQVDVSVPSHESCLNRSWIASCLHRFPLYSSGSVILENFSSWEKKTISQIIKFWTD